jgi:ABC-type phosphate transport system ATPase subunit
MGGGRCDRRLEIAGGKTCVTWLTLNIAELSFEVLIGMSCPGKSTFARKHFKPMEVLSSDYCRGSVSDDENRQAATVDFAVRRRGIEFPAGFCFSAWK